MIIDQTDRVNHSSNRHYYISRGKFFQNCPKYLPAMLNDKISNTF